MMRDGRCDEDSDDYSMSLVSYAYVRHTSKEQKYNWRYSYQIYTKAFHSRPKRYES